MLGRREAIFGTIGAFGSCLLPKLDYNITSKLVAMVKVTHISNNHTSYNVVSGDYDYINVLGIDRFRKVSFFLHENKEFDTFSVYQCNDNSFKIRFLELKGTNRRKLSV